MYLKEDGAELDAEFAVDWQGSERSIVLESQRGNPPRNVDYNRCLELILERLGKAGGMLSDACVDTSRTTELSRAQRRLELEPFEYPVRLGGIDVVELRRRINKASAWTARAPSARGGGNPTRRIRMFVGIDVPSRTSLEQLLETGELPRPRGASRRGQPRTPDEERAGMGLGFGPAWAQRWGEDERHGAFASFVVDGIEQRMRWVPPTRKPFMMGSPEGEMVRDGDETPHPVTLTAGFWMAETPCTQVLWEAVMGSNPSEFRSPRRPVEQVSWEDVQDFLGRLNRRVHGLEAGLPTEAQWEYACRAGTETATYAGPLEVLGDRNAPVLHDIAWYGGNSGVGWDIEEGWDSSEWEDKQFDHTMAGTREVRGKQSNPWGLHDMLGNVWEWCADWYGPYEAGEVTDPTGPSSGLHRVMRGGGWSSDARGVRAAYRGIRTPGDRYDNLGFRLVRGQGLRQPDERSESKTSKDEQARVRDEPGGRPASPQVAVPRRSRPRAQHPDIAPSWASGGGLDQHGRWATLRIEDIEQRMRWIEPGSFLMGAPEDESGRDDDETQHEVTLTKGFWMGETPCTQALWELVTGENPSRFRSLRRPVEQVSWDEVQEFLAALEHRRPGLQARLPTEAQWEYACRAGTMTATYAGPMEILGENNAPVLDDIAWYGGNSGVDFDQEEGVDSSKWPEKQYPHERAGTREVGGKRANPWGLHDMHGNVWEWCSDWYGPYNQKKVIDPVGPESGQGRVFRGGSWSTSARYVRAAYRIFQTPGDRSGNLGFRLVRGS